MSPSRTACSTTSRVVPATGGDDGPVEPGQQVEQGGLARIGPPHDGTVHTLPQDSTGIIIPDEGVQLFLHGSQGGYQLGIPQRGNVLLREIHPGSQMGLQGGQDILFSPDLLTPARRSGRHWPAPHPVCHRQKSGP